MKEGKLIMRKFVYILLTMALTATLFTVVLV